MLFLLSEKCFVVELTLTVLLNFVGDKFCEYRSEGTDTYKSVLLAYSDASDRYGIRKVKEIIRDSQGLNFSAVATALLKCPQHLK